MKLIFENLGAVEYAEIELSELTVVCGENNTGKTYVTYLIYCLLTTWRKFIDIDLKRDLLSLRRNGVVKIDLQVKVADPWSELCEEALKRFLNTFPEMMASKSELFSDLSVRLDIPLGLVWKEREFKNELRSAKGNLLVTMTKPANSVELELVALKSDELSAQSMVSLGEFIEERLFDMMLAEAIPDVFIASTERTGATTFRKQLNLATSNILELLSQSHKEGADSITPDRVFETIYGRQDYALPVRRNVQFVNQLPDTNSEDGELYKSAPGLLKRFENIVGGTYATNKDGVTYFQPSGTKLKLGLGEVSSSVRSLLIVWYWLKHFAKKGDMLMLDEPELNLHPANQRRLARFIVALINHGVKVFITTHSDYIVKEFNTLIMFNQGDQQLDAVRNKYKEYLPEDRLAYDKVSLYMAREEKVLRPGNTRKTKIKTLVRAEISPTLGIEAVSFDETIDEMNAIQEAIYYGLN
ncbi:MAG: AAA family ATPase [Ignavibacteria bacterium]|nr:AAA family ATPase [Ignavibacteria bacterium]